MTPIPIIVKIEKEEVVGGYGNWKGYTSIVKYTGIDEEGKRWTFYRDQTYSYDGTTSSSLNYNYREA